MINVFIGSAPEFDEPADVLIASLMKHHDPENLNIRVMRAGTGIWEGWANHGPTGFTLFRFAIPEMMGFSGFAIYLDCDMLVLDDIEDLEMCGQSGKWVKSRVGGDNGDCVSVIDCSAVRGLTWPSIEMMRNGGWRKWDVRRLLQPIMVDGVPDAWQVCDSWNPDAKLIHFTDLKTQPWFGHNAPHPSQQAVQLWMNEWTNLKA